MKHVFLLAAAMLAGATAASAQPTDVPTMKCDAPQMPGTRMMEDRAVRTRFERQIKTHGDCVKAYVAERQAAVQSHQDAMKAHGDAGNKAVADYNALLKSMNEAAAGK